MWAARIVRRAYEASLPALAIRARPLREVRALLGVGGRGRVVVLGVELIVALDALGRARLLRRHRRRSLRRSLEMSCHPELGQLGLALVVLGRGHGRRRVVAASDVE